MVLGTSHLACNKIEYYLPVPADEIIPFLLTLSLFFQKSNFLNAYVKGGVRNTNLSFQTILLYCCIGDFTYYLPFFYLLLTFILSLMSSILPFSSLHVVFPSVWQNARAHYVNVGVHKPNGNILLMLWGGS